MAYIQIQFKEGLKTITADAISITQDNSLVVIPEAGSQNFIRKTMNVQWNLWTKESPTDEFYTMVPDSFQIEEIVNPDNYEDFQALTGVQGMSEVEAFIRAFYI